VWACHVCLLGYLLQSRLFLHPVQFRTLTTLRRSRISTRANRRAITQTPTGHISALEQNLFEGDASPGLSTDEVDGRIVDDADNYHDSTRKCANPVTTPRLGMHDSPNSVVSSEAQVPTISDFEEGSSTVSITRQVPYSF
jgi:hypothetical protein